MLCRCSIQRRGTLRQRFSKHCGIDTLTNKVIATIPIGQAAQAVTYVPDAVPEGDGTQHLEPLGVAGQAAHFTMVQAGGKHRRTPSPPTSVTLFDQGLVQVLEASVTGLEPMQPYVLALSERDGSGELEPLEDFMTNAAGAAIVNTVGPIRQIIQGEAAEPHRLFLVIASGSSAEPGQPVQIQAH